MLPGLSLLPGWPCTTCMGHDLRCLQNLAMLHGCAVLLLHSRAHASFALQELHYNQHGLLLLQGQGIYRLADNWCAAADSLFSCDC